MEKEPAVIVKRLSDIKAIHMYLSKSKRYLFRSKKQSLSELMEIFNQTLNYLNPDLSEGFPLRHVTAGIAIEPKEITSQKEQTLGVVQFLDALKSTNIIAFCQVFQFTMRNNPSNKKEGTLVTFIKDAYSPHQEWQQIIHNQPGSIIYLTDPIGLVS